jgi:two-component system, NtrC family, response regulator AtoC
VAELESTQSVARPSDKLPYLLIIEGDNARRHTLAGAGPWTIGRADDCQIRVDLTSVSRRHARLAFQSGDLTLQDLGSHNGSQLNGTAIEGETKLVSGDVIAVGEAVLVAYLGRHTLPRGELAGPEQILDRLEGETDRARRSGRLSVAFVDLRARLDDGVVAGIAPLVRTTLRASDAIGRLDDRTLLAVMPERDGDDGERVTRALLSALAPAAPHARAGVAVFPVDAADSAGLLAAAREAAHSASEPLARAGADGSTISIGEQTCRVADPGMRAIYQLLERLAASEMPVLLSGETGVGKEMAALVLHHRSPRARGPFVPVNCAAVPTNLLESELFGYKRGAFSGANADKRGFFAAAGGGTLFLDEVGELPASAQAALLRVVETRQYYRVGDVTPLTADVCLVAATNRDLAAEVEAGRFRKDLYFRLSVAHLALPPLRDRPRDIPILARTFLERARARLDRRPLALSDELLHVLAAHAFPGNVRELANAMQYVATVADGERAEPQHLPPGFGVSEPERLRTDPVSFRPIADEIAELEARRMREALAATGGNQSRAADLIAMPRRTFVTKLSRYGMRPTLRNDILATSASPGSSPAAGRDARDEVGTDPRDDR